VEIKLKLPNSIQLRRVFRVLPELNTFDFGPNMDGSYSLLLGDYEPAEPVALLLEILIPPRAAGNYRLAQALLTWDDLSSSQADAPARRQSPRQDILAVFSEVATTPLNGKVMNIVEKVTAYQMGSAAMEAAQQAARSADPRVKNAATLRLREAATRLIDMGETGMANTMLHQANSLERSGVVDANATKKFRYETRHLAQGALDGE
jgi:Ca-activated chloride channel family protein